MDCTHRSLQNIPHLEKKGTISTVKTLDLSHNAISNITGKPFTYLVSLEWLNLSKNALASVQAESFTGLESLCQLDLSHNNLFQLSLHDGAFIGLPSLHTLNLSGSSFSLSSNSFQGLQALEVLDLSRNTLEYIPEKAFDHLQNLKLPEHSSDSHLYDSLSATSTTTFATKIKNVLR